MLKHFSLVAILLMMTSLAIADTHHHYPRKHYKGMYKGETFLQPAAPAVAQYAHFSFGGGPYVGFSLGARDNYSSTPVVYKGLEFTLDVGYGFLFSNGFYIAEEVFASDGFQLQNYSGGNGSARSTWSAAFSVLPGYLILDNLIGYARLGVVKTYFSSAGTSNNGGQVGLGLEAALTESWDLRGEYIYSFYESKQYCVKQPGDLGAVKSDIFNLGLVYKFM